MNDRKLIDKTIRTNLNLIKTLNNNPQYDGLIFRKDLLVRGIEVLGKKTTLSFVERTNLMRFNDKWNMEI